MDNLVNETNSKLKEIVDNLTSIKEEYEKKLEKNSKDIKVELDKVKKYKEDFFEAKAKIEKMNDDIDGFEEDYQKLVDRFKDDELANILIAANKEISAKIEERKRKIVKDKMAMNELVEKAELSKGKLVKLTAEKKALELCLDKVLDAYDYYKESIEGIINYSDEHRDNLSSKEEDIVSKDNSEEELSDETTEEQDEQLREDEQEEISNDDVIDINVSDEYDDDENDEVSLVQEIQEIKTIDELEDDDDKENHTLAINEIPSEEYNYNDNLELENEIDFDDSIEDENEE